MSEPDTQRRSLRQRLDHNRGALVIGHRGAMGYRPENTLPSFEYALEQGADGVELDVHLSRDRHLVVIHDETVDRTTNGHGAVCDLTLAEIRQLDAGDGARVPTLDEVLTWAHQHAVLVDIEIKNAPVFYAGIEDAVVAAVRRTGMSEQVIVTSFDHCAVRRVGELDARIALGVLYAARPADAGIGLARLVDAGTVLPHVAYACADDIDTAHAAGLAVVPWTTSDPERVHELLAWGVDAICTNHPDVVRKAATAVAR